MRINSQRVGLRIRRSPAPVQPKTNFSISSRYQLNQLGSKAASESTFKKSNTCGVSNTRLYFFFTFLVARVGVMMMISICEDYLL